MQDQIDDSETCANCKFMRRGELDANTMERPQVCVWGPPQVLMIPTPQGMATGAMFPPVRDANYCGQFTRRTDG